MFKSFVSLVVLASLVAAAPSLVARAVPAGFAVTSTSYSGAGCPASSAVVNVAADSSAFSVVYSEFTLNVGPSLPSPDTKVCTVTLNLAIPSGYTVGLEPLESGSFRQDDGTVGGGFGINHAFTSSQLTLTTSAVLIADGPTSTGVLIIDSLDGHFTFTKD
ncbi:hypothetical protein DFP72DRAFT_904152 [Ephemerocybe angulata]|uniref:DUF4360 domain-containing protein n=1 Tax=Ephemerocybe angulata TaxID=980116 RepID=A0A8H6HSX5_9AGAR|nr:hypothetical protein DFP72DRAFT_904152 [Tulosesus angulatus]